MCVQSVLAVLSEQAESGQAGPHRAHPIRQAGHRQRRNQEMPSIRSESTGQAGRPSRLAQGERRLKSRQQIQDRHQKGAGKRVLGHFGVLCNVWSSHLLR
jgi:hypothetical protein